MAMTGNGDGATGNGHIKARKLPVIYSQNVATLGIRERFQERGSGPAWSGH